MTTNGTDAARIVSALGISTKAKTIIRRVLQLPEPREGEIAKVGIDEWAWKKGYCYGNLDQENGILTTSTTKPFGPFSYVVEA